MAEKQKSSKQGRNLRKCERYRLRGRKGTAKGQHPHSGRKPVAQFVSITGISTGPVLLPGEASLTESLVRAGLPGGQRNQVHHLPFPQGYRKSAPKPGDGMALHCEHCGTDQPQRRFGQHARKCKRDHRVVLTFAA